MGNAVIIAAGAMTTAIHLQQKESLFAIMMEAA